VQCASINIDERGDGEKSRNTVAKNLGKHQNETNRLSGGFEIMFGLESECEEQCDMQQLTSCVDYLVAMARAGNCRETTRIYTTTTNLTAFGIIIVMSRPEYRSISFVPHRAIAIAIHSNKL